MKALVAVAGYLVRCAVVALPCNLPGEVAQINNFQIVQRNNSIVEAVTFNLFADENSNCGATNLSVPSEQYPCNNTAYYFQLLQSFPVAVRLSHNANNGSFAVGTVTVAVNGPLPIILQQSHRATTVLVPW